MRISDWSSDVCSSDLREQAATREGRVEGIGALAARQIGFKADDTALLVVVHIHENPTKIIVADWKGKKYCHDAVIALAREGESICHLRGLYFAAIGAERHALFIDGHERIL